jgi:hypothetical protein
MANDFCKVPIKTKDILSSVYMVLPIPEKL